MKNILYTLSVAVLAGGLALSACEGPATKTDDGLTEIREGFKNPPVKARSKVYWWWING